jgi:hypothetical protein
MRYVIDSAMAFKWVVTEVHQDKALLLRDDFSNRVHELMAPDFFPVAHGLTRAERQNRLTRGQAIGPGPMLWLLGCRCTLRFP